MDHESDRDENRKSGYLQTLSLTPSGAVQEGTEDDSAMKINSPVNVDRVSIQTHSNRGAKVTIPAENLQDTDKQTLALSDADDMEISSYYSRSAIESQTSDLSGEFQLFRRSAKPSDKKIVGSGNTPSSSQQKQGGRQASSNNSDKNKSMSSGTSDTVDFDENGRPVRRLNLKGLGICGRNAELATIRNCFEQAWKISRRETRANDTEMKVDFQNDQKNEDSSKIMEAPEVERKRQILLISGASGTGKSKLAQTLHKLVHRKNNHVISQKRGADDAGAENYENVVGALFVRGEFGERNSLLENDDGGQDRAVVDGANGTLESNTSNFEPYSGISEACSEICGAILNLHHSSHLTRQRQSKQHQQNLVDDHDGNDDIIEQVNQQPEPADKGSITPLQREQEQQDRFRQICREIKDELGPELGLFSRMIPVLEEILDVNLPADELPKPVEAKQLQGANRSVPEEGDSRSTKDRFYYAFVRFMRIITNHFAPLIMVLDDLHRADASSIGLLEALVADRNNHKMMLVGVYRSSNETSNEGIVSEDHQNQQAADAQDNTLATSSGEAVCHFRSFLEHLESKNKEVGGYVSLTKIHIGNLELEQVHEIVLKALDYENNRSNNRRALPESTANPHRTLGLAQVCLSKTLGNPFFLIQFLSILQSHQLMKYNNDTDAWEWQDEEIKSETSAADNVADLLKSKMYFISEKHSNVLEMLRIAACLGSTFSLRMFETLWTNWTNTTTVDTFTAGIKLLEKQGLLTSKNASDSLVSPTISYSWTHDKIQQAAILLIPQSDRSVFRQRVGEVLLAQLDPADLDTHIFVVVNLLNENADNLVGNTVRIRLAELNCKAGEKAVSLSAFESAASYVSKGIKLLPPSFWTAQYRLSLQLFSVGAKAEGYLGNVKTLELYCKEVMLRQEIPLQDKLTVYNAFIDSISNRGIIHDSVISLLEILGQFGCRFPHSSILINVLIVKNVIQIKATMKSRDLTSLPRMNDIARIEQMKLLDKLATCFYKVHDDRMPLAIFRSLNWTMRYGYCVYSPVAFATTGMMLTGVLGDLQGGSTYGRNALKLLEKTGSSDTAARTMFCVYSFLFPWTEPAADLLEPLQKAYDIGLKSGDTESATWAIYHRSILMLLIGGSLEEIQHDLGVYSKEMEYLRRDHVLYVSKFVRQALVNLIGHNNKHTPTLMHGDIISEEEFKHCLRHPFLKPGTQVFHGMLLAYFGEHVKHADLAIELGHDYLFKAHVATPTQMGDTLLKGVSCYAAAQMTGKKKYTKIACIFRSIVKKWCRSGNPNVQHFLPLLDAEAMALKGNKVKAIELYKTAVSMAKNVGCIQDAALACERLGEYQMHIMNDRDEAQRQFEQAVTFWRCWGANAKVSHLEMKYSCFFPKPSGIVALGIDDLLPPKETP